MDLYRTVIVENHHRRQGVTFDGGGLNLKTFRQYAR